MQLTGTSDSVSRTKHVKTVIEVAGLGDVGGLVRDAGQYDFSVHVLTR